MKKYNKLYSNGCSYMWGHGHNNADIKNGVPKK
jgi:hypothetical protein